MIVWGGSGDVDALNTGGRYRPGADTWSGVTSTVAPAARDWATVVWTGSEMIIWGGFNGTSYLNTGGRFNPAANTWTAVPVNGAPTGSRR